MGELINGRTPEEIKMALELCNVPTKRKNVCESCPYTGECTPENRPDQPGWDALLYIQHLEAERDAALAKVPTWISVKERLPEDCVSVLVWAVYHNEDGWDWAMSEIDNYCDMVGWDNTADPEAREVTHWMPMPESPKGE